MTKVIEVRVAGTNDDESELRSLLRWLKADEGVGPYAHGVLASSQPARTDHMGALLDLISLTVSGGLGAAQLAAGLAQWRAARHSAPSIIVHRGEARVEVYDADPETVRRLTELLAGGQGGDDGAS
ncbi:hypothetical protein [Streptomyces sp. NPDC101393]|uniref:effector-associated constant component EACC1 n=1 Tax=Streptomyces sp. NPDC101393 TaxID=3366141 RepID=UPI0037FCF01D